MVLCVGAQTVVVYIGADGTPVSVPHHCPDCALHALDMLETDWPLLGDAPVYAHHAVLAPRPARTTGASFYGLARAPPVLI